MSIEIWEGSAEVTGYGALAAHDGTYPVETGSVNDETGERVDLKISEPTQIAGPLASSMYKQTVKLRVTADPSRVQDLAMEMLLVTADALAFATDRNVQTSLSHLTKVTSQDDQSEGDTKLFMRRFKGPQELAVLDTGFLAYIWGQLDDVETDRSRRIIRALRWLRRASLTDDEVEEFATLAMAYEAMTSLLPKPSTRGEVKKQSKGEGSPTSVEILTHWAVDRCGIPEEHWRQVGRMRNGLFHGGLTENTEVRSGLAAAIPYIRLALGLALKHALNLSSDNLPRLSLPLFSVTDIEISGLRFTPAPDSAPKTTQDEEPDPSDK